MARKPVRHATFRREDVKSWNFILFLALAFILLVVVLSAMTSLSTDIRSKAGLICPQVTLPRAEDCPGGWTYQRDVTNGCPTFVCKVK
ncbi:hypothetical protein A2Z00_01865 [Candidatus Gottesmanbacteria bacterium RBG_13_45_10]|uniref:Uncharacterized protein n=1 Tax=Candidatus Gottesmanbacteria bacterium RBG_13_45_10 TaxID=1798370 RepID=A0A1F5ZHJ3_9BACT|nr:MAG: hypothetical protein A2Z00_01865 [Candidatus Gottesmanbacteria bacterium RBG_13_45_10]